MHIKQKSFTLVEMLIVIVIIGILAAALVPRLVSVQWKARDTQRKIDLKSIFNANEVYRIDFGRYAQPINTNATCAYEIMCLVYSTQLQPRISTLSGVMSGVPVDPRNNQPGLLTGYYNYTYWNVYRISSSARVDTYDLTAQLENSNDPDRCAVKQYTRFYPPEDLCQYSSMLYNLSPHSNSY